MRSITLIGGPLDGTELELERFTTEVVFLESDTTGLTYRYDQNAVGEWCFSGIVGDEEAATKHWCETADSQRYP